MAQVTERNGVHVETSKSNITVDNVKSTEFSKPGFMQAQLRQVITTKSNYPSARVGNSLNDSLFAVNEFAGIELKEFTSNETRIAWMDVPTGTTVEDVVARLAKAPKANLYKILSNSPILTEEQKSSIERGQRTMDFFAGRQAVRYPDGVEKDGVDVSGQLIPDQNGNIQYKVNAFSSVGADDIDNRTTNIEEHYFSPELLAEFKGAGVIEGQNI